MMVIGLGAKSAASAGDIVAALRDTTEGLGRRADAVATRKAPGFAAALDQAAQELGFRLAMVPESDLKDRASDCVTQSERSLRLFGLGSVAEAAALAAAGRGSALIMPRRIIAGVTIAVALSQDEVEAAL